MLNIGPPFYRQFVGFSIRPRFHLTKHMGDIKLSGAAWSFVGASLVESANVWRALGVEAMDLIALPDGLLDRVTIEKDPKGQAKRAREPGLALSNLLCILGSGFDDRPVNKGQAKRAREPGLALSNLLCILGSGFDDRPVNSADKGVRDLNFETIKRLIEFCVSAEIPSLIILPGIDQLGISHEEALKISGDTMTEMSLVARDAGLLMVFEPHIESVLENPFETLTFLKQNPDLKIVLDYSHFIAQGFNPSDVDPLVPYAGHVHLRQGSNKKLQVRWEAGEIDFRNVIGLLKKTGYKGYAAFEYEHDPCWMEMDKVDVMTETIKMRDTVKPLL